jgi:hypothetical protein
MYNCTVLQILKQNIKYPSVLYICTTKHTENVPLYGFYKKMSKKCASYIRRIYNYSVYKYNNRY